MANFCNEGLILAGSQEEQHSPILGDRHWAEIKIWDNSLLGTSSHWPHVPLQDIKEREIALVPLLSPSRKMIYYSFLMWKLLRSLLSNLCEPHLHLLFDYSRFSIFQVKAISLPLSCHQNELYLQLQKHMGYYTFCSYLSQKCCQDLVHSYMFPLTLNSGRKLPYFTISEHAYFTITTAFCWMALALLHFRTSITVSGRYFC